MNTPNAPVIFEFREKDHSYWLNGIEIPSITQTLKATGWINEEFFDEQGRIRGTAVHRACWYLAEGDLNWATVKPEYVPYVRAFQRFLEETKIQILFCEKPLYSKTYWFAGTPDIFGIINGRHTLIDIKTGLVGLHAALQTAGQQVAVEESGLGKVQDRMALKLNDDGTYKRVPFTRATDKNMFLSMVAAVNRRKNAGVHWRSDR